MRILLVSLNSKYVHTNLALRYLRDTVQPHFPDTVLQEFTINEPVERIAGEIFEAKADVVGFSCYIWNVMETLAVIRRLRPVLSETRIVVGGPEVSFDAGDFLKEHPEVDAVVYGEGEQTFLEYLRACSAEKNMNAVLGLAWRENGTVQVNPPRNPLPFSEIPLPYQVQEDFRGRLVYVETTRGCPFNCQYCLSSTSHGVRYLDPEVFRIILRRLFAYGARTVKFVDRTFNVKKEHAFRILDVVREEALALPREEGIRVHCEIAGELLDEEWVEYLKKYPAGLVQFEVGVQSTYQATLEIIDRPQHFERWAGYIRELKRLGTIPLHLDLIAGLPEEDWNHFRQSFNDVYAVQPDMLQLGFLKVLKGSGMREKSQRYGLVFTPDPPYTILATNVLSHAELLKLQRLEDVLDRYYNSGKFSSVLTEALVLLRLLYSSPFDFYHELAEHWNNQGWFRQSWSGKALFEKIWEFLDSSLDRLQSLKALSDEELSRQREALRDRLRFDYFLWERPGTVPEFLQIPSAHQPPDYANRKPQIQLAETWQDRIAERREMDRRQWIRATAVEYFAKEHWVLFFYHKGRTHVYPFKES